MPGLGATARDPNTDYLVYEFSFNDRIFYVGLAWGTVRHLGRWGHVLNLVKHERAGSLKPSKAMDLAKTSNQVIATLIKQGLPEHRVNVYWRGKGRENAAVVEQQRILELVNAGVVLANVQRNPKRTSLPEVLAYIGVRGAA